MINFLKYRRVYLLISLMVIGVGLFSIFNWGFIYSIDFVGGTNLEYTTSKKTDEKNFRAVLEKEQIRVVNLQAFENRAIARTNPIDEKKEAKIRSELKKSQGEVTLQRFETVGPTIGRETLIKTLWALGLGVLAILLYMSIAFRGLNFALAAIVALIHDLLVLVGVYSLLSYFFSAELDTLFVTAALTTMSFSVHDTIVIFDKIREHVRLEGKGNIQETANKALTETMVRSLNNSMTIVFVLLALMLIGGSTIKFFAAALLIGTITGTYSSPFVATPVYTLLERRKK